MYQTDRSIGARCASMMPTGATHVMSGTLMVAIVVQMMKVVVSFTITVTDLMLSSIV
jgi:hypothetical protein